MLPEKAFNESAMPVNSLPFIRRVKEILYENHCNDFDALPAEERQKVKACFFVLLSQLYGQLFKIDAIDMFKELEREGDYDNDTYAKN